MSEERKITWVFRPAASTNGFFQNQRWESIGKRNPAYQIFGEFEENGSVGFRIFFWGCQNKGWEWVKISFPTLDDAKALAEKMWQDELLNRMEMYGI
jgi:hypothetical protein